MTDHPLATLLPALDIAVFERVSPGAFQPLAPLPSWFPHLSRDGTFPFLGHILDEANLFWNLRTVGVCEWGPCTGVEDSGQEFHYLVKAVTAGSRAYLVFQLDAGAEKVREILQKVRSDALAAARKPQAPR
jgi:hypothetical protein